MQMFDLLAWCRRMTSVHGLKPIEAQLLLTLATYCDREASCWPSIRRLAADMGFRVTKRGTCSAISAAMVALEEKKLVWSSQRGMGKSAKRELLFDPLLSVVAESKAPLPSVVTESIPVDNSNAPESLPSVTTDAVLSVRTDAEEATRKKPNTYINPIEEARKCSPSERRAPSPSQGLHRMDFATVLERVGAA